MASDDAGFDETSLDPDFVPPGPRRSTFTPPTGSVPDAPQQASAEHDDDELANALAADLDRLASGSVPVIAEPPSERVWELTPEELVPSGPEPVDELPAWSSLPAPDPSQAVLLPEGPPVLPDVPVLLPEIPQAAEVPPEPVVRDPELASLLEQAGLEPSGGTLSAIEQLEAQLAGFGPPLVNPDLPPTVEVSPTSIATPQWQEPLPNEPLPNEPLPNEPPVVAAIPVEAPPPLPSWEIPAPSAAWASTLGETEQLADTPPEAPDAPEAPEEESRFAPHPEPEFLDSVDPDHSEPSYPEQANPEQTYPEQPDAGEPGLWVLPVPVEPSLTSPPPLVEPPPLGGPPILPSQAAGHPPIPIEPIPEYEDVVVAEVIEDAPPAQAPPAPSAFSFDDLLSGPAPADNGEALPDEGASFAMPGLFEGPPPVNAAEGVPLDTGSIAVVDRVYEGEIDDDVDETDRVFAGLVGGVAVASPPSGPIATVRVPDDEVVLGDGAVPSVKASGIEQSGPEPTPTDQRIGRAARLFWLWFAANSSILGVGLGAVVFALGMSLRQSVVAILGGIAVSFVPMALSTLAGKRSGQPTMIVSRATFGVVGNVVPALLAVVTRVFWGAVLLWLLASAVAVILVGAELDAGLGDGVLVLIALAAAALIAVLIAVGGYHIVARMQLVVTIMSAILVVGFIVMTFSYVDLSQALTTPDGSWLLTVTGAVLVFSFVGLVWAMSGADVARYQRPDSSGGASASWATLGATVPSFVLIAYGALLAASDKGIASGFVQSPLDTLALMLPNWYPVPLIAATALGLLSGVVMTIYSGGFALQALGIRIPRPWSVVVVGLLIAVTALAVTLTLTGITELFRDLATTLAVPTAAWVGIFGAEVLMRRRPISSEALLARGGIYGAVRWGNLIGFVVITAIGFGLTTASVGWLSWQGYLFGLLRVPAEDPLAGTDLGVLVSLGLGILLPLVIGFGAIRRQEDTGD